MLVLDNSDLENRSRNGEQDQSGAPSSTEGQTDFAKGALAHATEKNKMEQIYVPIEVYGLQRCPIDERTKRLQERQAYLRTTANASHGSLEL